jgi:outer membrane receptor for ferrienterochelin and colicin
MKIFKEGMIQSFCLKILCAIFLLTPYAILFSQAVEKKVFVGKFKSMNTSDNQEYSKTVAEKLSAYLNTQGYQAQVVDSSSLTQIPSEAREGHLYVTGSYTKKSGRNLTIYAQIYDPISGTIIDAISLEDEWDREEFENLKLSAEEILEEDSIRMNKFSRKLTARIKINPNKKENRENINKYLLDTPLAESNKFPIATDKTVNISQDVFQFLSDMEVVTATRTKTKIKDAPAAVYVITSDQIRERGYRVLTDALKDVPGFDFQHTYGIYPYLIHQRGIVGENNRTLVYVDGIPDNNINEIAVLAGTNQFPLHNVERIEIVSGPASSLYGANAFNGIINIITKNGVDRPGHKVGVTYGAWESNFRNPGYTLELSSRGSMGEKNNAFQYSVGGYFYKTDGPNFGGISDLRSKTYDKNNVTDYLEHKSCGGPCVAKTSDYGAYWSPGYNNSKAENYNVTANVSRGGFRLQTVNWHYNQGEGTFANGTNQLDVKDKGLETGKWDARNLARGYGVLMGNASTKGFIGSNWNFQNNSISSGYTHHVNDKLNIDTELVFRTTQIIGSSKEEYPNKTDKYAYLRPGDTTISPHYSRMDRNYGAETKMQYTPNSMFSTILGVSANHFIATKDYGSNEVYTYNNFSGYVQQVVRPVQILAITVGYRYDEFTTFGKASSPRISAILSPTSNLTLKFLAGTGFRAPTVKELFSETPQRKPNPDLKPELLRSFEFGIGYRFSKYLYSSAHVYQNKITNLILEVTTTDSNPRGTTRPKGGTWQQNQNLGEAYVMGAEIENSIILNEHWKIDINYTYSKGYYDKLPSSLPSSPSTRGRLGDNPVDDLRAAIYKTYTGVAAIPERGDIPIISPHKAFLGVTWSFWENYSLYAGMNYIDVRRTKATDPEKSIEGYKFFKLNFHWKNFLTSGMYLNVLVNNASNMQFFDPGIRSASGGYYPTMHPLERRNIWISVGYNF